MRGLALLVLCACVMSCGRRAPHAPKQAEPAASSTTSPTPSGPLGPAPLDAELSRVVGARARYVADPVFGGRVYLLEVNGRRGDATGEEAADAAPPLVLVHGLGDAGARDFYPILAGLAEGRRVIAFDLPGFARSNGGGAPPYEPKRYADVLAHVIDAYAGGRADVLGHSMGGAIALEHSARHARQVRKLVLIDAAGILYRDAFIQNQIDASVAPLRTAAPGNLPAPVHALTRGVAGTVAGAGHALFSVARPWSPRPEAVNTLEPAPPIQAALGLVEHNFAPALGSSRAPTLVLWGQKDTIAPLRVAELLESRLANARLVVLDDVAHVPMREATDRTLLEVLAHLNEGDGPRPASPPSSSAPLSSSIPSTDDAAPRDVRCSHQANFRLSGSYGEIVLDHCSRAVLRNVVARRLVLEHSSVEGVHVRVTEGVVADESVVRLTGGSLSGPISLDTDGSTFDLAGVELLGQRAVHVRGNSSFLVSACSLGRGAGARHLHGRFGLKPNESL